MKRRLFLSRTMLASASAVASTSLSIPGFTSRALAVEPWRKAGHHGALRLGLAAYSLREYFTDSSHNQAPVDAAKKIDLFRFVDYCAEQRCDGAELTSYYFPKTADREYMLRLRRHCFLRGMGVSGTAVGNTFTLPKGEKRDAEIAHVKKWIENAQALGAPHIRVFAGDTKSVPLAEAKRLCIEALEECAEYAGRHGVLLGIENHGGITAEAADLLDLVKAVRSPWVGVNLDTGNFHTDDPYRDLARCAPYAVNVQFKADMSVRGGKAEKADFRRLTRILRDAGYEGFVTLEYESKPDPWEAVPALLGELRGVLS